MNNYNDYYNYLNNGYGDMNYMTNPNSMICDLNYQTMYPNAMMSNITDLSNTSKDKNILEAYKGFKRGNKITLKK